MPMMVEPRSQAPFGNAACRSFASYRPPGALLYRRNNCSKQRFQLTSFNPRSSPMHVRAAVLSSLILSMALSSTFARDRNQDRDSPDSPSESPPQVVEARSKADAAYERGEYAKVIELATWLIENYPNDNVH